MALEENREKETRQILVRMSGVSVSRAEGCGFQEINWAISEGEHWGILGDSGSGKSLLIDALTRRAPLSAGTISYSSDSPDIATFSSENCRQFLTGSLAYVQARWESSAQVHAPLARDLLKPDPDSRLLRTLQVDHVLDRPIISLSSGEFRKFMLARVLLADPRLLVLEDPFSGLDHESEVEFRRFLEILCRRSTPGLVLMVSQPQQLVEGISHLVLVADYRIVKMGPVTQNAIAELRESIQSVTPIQPKCQKLPPGPAGESIIEMRDVGVRYGDSQILEGINWTVREGENWAIQGPNGAGKSTLLSLVTADNPQAYVNNIRLFGRQRGSGESIWDIRRQIGSVSPELQLCYPPEATALEVVCSGLFDSIGLYRVCSPEQEDEAKAWLENLGTHDLLGRAFWSLSASEQRLVLLARALVKRPRLLVLDEPCLGLDASHVARFLRQLEELCRIRPTTVLYVTHRPEEFPSIITHLLKLERGRIRSIGPV
jgi:molybdate transport system ATP-binding protein